MQLNVGKEVAAMQEMPVAQLRDRYAEVFGETTKRYRYYVCNNATKRGWHNCSGQSLPAHEIERFVLDQIRCIGRDPAVIGETIRQARMQATQRIELLTQERKRLDKDLGKYERSTQALVGADLSAKDTARLAELQSRIQPIEQRLSEVRDELQSLQREVIDEADVTTALAQFDTVWQALKVAEQNRLIRLLIERGPCGSGPSFEHFRFC